MVVHTFLWVVTGHCLRAGIIESRNFFVLRRILVKFHIRTWLIESFLTMYRSWWCAEEKLHFTPVHTLCQLNRDEELFPPLQRVVEFRARYRQIPGRGFRGYAKFGDCATYSLGAIRVCTHTHTYTHTHSHKHTHTHTHTHGHTHTR